MLFSVRVVVSTIAWASIDYRFWKLGAAPGAEVDRDASAATVVADHQDIPVRTLPVIDEAIRAVIPIRMDVARVLNIRTHHLAAMLGHVAIFPWRPNVRNGSIPDGPVRVEREL